MCLYFLFIPSCSWQVLTQWHRKKFGFDGGVGVGLVVTNSMLTLNNRFFPLNTFFFEGEAAPFPPSSNSWTLAEQSNLTSHNKTIPTKPYNYLLSLII